MEEVFKGIGFLLVFLLALIAIAIALVVLSTVGVLFGSGVSLGNYYKSFRKNVAFEKPYV